MAEMLISKVSWLDLLKEEFLDILIRRLVLRENKYPTKTQILLRIIRYLNDLLQILL